MFRGNASRRYTLYKPEHTGRSRLFGFLKFVVFLLLAYFIFTHLLLGSYSITTGSMTPTLETGERIFATSLPYGARIPFSDGRLPGLGRIKRGDLVVVELPLVPPQHPIPGMARGLVRFFTLQKRDPAGDEPEEAGRRVVRRVIALPGDMVRMEGFVLYVQAAGQNRFASEFDASPTRYQVDRRELPDGWSEEHPFSGHMQPQMLGENEYFVAADNRWGGLDSRHFGPISRGRIHEKVIFRFWPMSRFGVPGS